MPVRMVESGSLRGFGLRLSCMVAQPEGIAGQYFGLFDRERDRDMVRQKGSRFKDGEGVAAICHRSDDQAQLINESILQKGLIGNTSAGNHQTGNAERSAQFAQ